MSLVTPITVQLKDNLCTPILTLVLENRPTVLAITSAVVLHSGLTFLGFPSWQCPLRYGAGIPCPGCGLSRAIAALLHGDWQTAATYHVFAPFLLMALTLIASVIILPPLQRQWLIHRVRIIEHKSGITAIMLVGLVAYWLIRLVFFHESFVQLIMG